MAEGRGKTLQRARRLPVDRKPGNGASARMHVKAPRLTPRPTLPLGKRSSVTAAGLHDPRRTAATYLTTQLTGETNQMKTPTNRGPAATRRRGARSRRVAAPAVTVTATRTTEAPALTVTRTAEPPSSYGTREVARRRLTSCRARHNSSCADIYRGSPSNAWSLWEATATGASATVTRSDFMAVFGAKCI